MKLHQSLGLLEMVKHFLVSFPLDFKDLSTTDGRSGQKEEEGGGGEERGREEEGGGR